MIRLTDNAVAECRRRLAGAGPEACVRLGVRPGGCAGRKPFVEIADGPGADDHVFGQDGLRVICAADALPVLDGSTVDFVAALVGGGFRFDNPNATTRCACGESFDIA